MNRVSVDYLKVCAIQDKSGTMINVNAKHQLIEILLKKVTCGILVRVIGNVIKRVELVCI